MMTKARFWTWQWLFWLGLLPSALHAQYLGGSDDGFAMAVLNTAVPCPTFTGGEADGAVTTWLVNPDSCGFFEGSDADGFSIFHLVNPDSCGFFEGSQSDGAVMTLFESPVACPTFYGEVADGFAMGEGICLSLAVAASELQGRMEGENAYLWWHTESELNNIGFMLQRSPDQFQWEEIAFLAGVTSSFQIRQYYHTDEQMPMGVSYYRWIQTDLDGSTTTSNVVSLMKTLDDNAQQLLVYPVPSRRGAPVHVYYQSDSEVEVELTVIQMNGQVLWRNRVMPVDGQVELALPVVQWSQGAYVLLVRQEGRQLTRRFMLF